MKLSKLWSSGILTTTALVSLALTGCSNAQLPTQDPIPLVDGKRTVMIMGLLPEWDLEDMVQRSDAVAIGILEEELGTKTEPGGLNDPPTYKHEFTDYKLTVETAFYPSTLPEQIAVLAETGVTPGNDNIVVMAHEGVPTFNVGERAILFMESLADEEEFGDGASRPVPDGFTGDDYYIAIVGGVYGKIMRSGEKWEDSRTGESFTTHELTSAIAEIKKNSPN